jgi:hypothetical protein
VNRRAQLVLLCEDTQHEAFARRFLSGIGWEARAIRVEKAPAGGGAAEQFVRRRFPVELRAHRSRQVSQVLVVVMDGDSVGVAARLRQLSDACADAGVEWRKDDEKIAIFIPTSNIETWLAYLEGEQVNEDRLDYPRLARERECQNHVQSLLGMCRAGRLREPFPISLRIACDEYQSRLR